MCTTNEITKIFRKETETFGISCFKAVQIQMISEKAVFGKRDENNFFLREKEIESWRFKTEAGWWVRTLLYINNCHSRSRHLMSQSDIIENQIMGCPGRWWGWTLRTCTLTYNGLGMGGVKCDFGVLNHLIYGSPCSTLSWTGSSISLVFPTPPTVTDRNFLSKNTKRGGGEKWNI